ncbi:hypothetical protein D5086_003760 [Populus alba]|uniref:Uncharacterized protein n=1 Tax=Populus alba TaxID=43335 RepID=A0ACC4D5M2_POPAL
MWCSSVEELPDEIGTLKELRLLDLTGCQNLRRIPVNLIGRLKKLEELLIMSFKDWDVVGCDSTEGMNASLTELSSLSHLAVLSLWIPKVECIPRDFVFPRAVQAGLNFLSRWSASRFTPAHIAIHPSLPKWEKPPPGFIKCNIDAAVDNNQEAMGAVFVLHDEEGALIMRGCWHANDFFPKVSRGFDYYNIK